jgi:hypothetical protein
VNGVEETTICWRVLNTPTIPSSAAPVIQTFFMIDSDVGNLSYENIDDLSFANLDEYPDRIQALMQKSRDQLFNAEQDSLWTSTLIKQSENSYVLLIDLPSLCADTTTLNQMVIEISRTYNRLVNPSSADASLSTINLPLQYADIAAWQNELFEAEEATIYRPGRIGGHSQTGVCNANDFFYRTIAGCIQLGSAPNTETSLNIAPVDYVSQAIISLSRQSASLGKIFHLTNSYPLKLNYLVNSIRSLGYPIQEVSYETWRSLLLSKAESDSESVIRPLISLFPESHHESENHSFADLKFDCENTLNGLANTSITCPAIDDQLLERYLAYLTRKQYINAPQFSKMHLAV